MKNQFLANSYRRLQSNFFLMIQLLIYDAMGDWTYLNTSSAAVEAVTADDVQRVAKTYFTEAGRNTLWYLRKAGTDEDPDLAGLEGQAKQMAKQMISQIVVEEDVSKLQMFLTQMQTSLSQAPEQFKPAMEVVIKKIQDRLAELAARR